MINLVLLKITEPMENVEDSNLFKGCCEGSGSWYLSFAQDALRKEPKRQLAALFSPGRESLQVRACLTHPCPEGRGGAACPSWFQLLVLICRWD